MSRALSVPLAEARALAVDFVAFGGRRLAHGVMLMLAGGLLEGVGLAMLVPIVSLLAPQAGGRWSASIARTLCSLGVTTRIGQLALMLAIFCLVVAIRAVTLAARDRLLSHVALGFVDHRRLTMIRSLARAPWQSLARIEHARIAHILSSEIGRLALACSTMMQILVAAIMLTVQAGLMIALSPVVAALAIGFSLFGLFAIVPLSARAALAGKAMSRSSFRIAGNAAQFMGGLKLAIAHDMAEAFVADIAAEGAALRGQQDGQQRFQSRVGIASASLSSVVGAAVLFGAVLVGVSTVTLVATLVILSRMAGPVRSLQQSVQQLFGVLEAFNALKALEVDLDASHADAPRVIAPSAPFGAIRFVGVGFAYPGAPTPIFSGLDLTIEAGEFVGLVGPSGTGKTTLVDLLTGLIEPGTGHIAIAGCVLGRDNVAGWRRRLAYVAQDSYLANASIRRNLLWGAEGRAEAALWRALALAGAADLVAAMPQGLETIVDERGTRLSGGERQRIALARAILRDPDLLILDEATNAIDIATERAVIDNIRLALPHTTILLIAHRAETLAACDRIVTLAPGVGLR